MITNLDPWLVPTRTHLADRLGVSRSYLWERLALVDSAVGKLPSEGPYDLAMAYALALEAGLPVAPPNECFPPLPSVAAAHPGLAAIAALVGGFHVRSEAFASLVEAGFCQTHPPAQVALLVAAQAYLADWHFHAMAFALPPTQRKAMHPEAVALLVDCYGTAAVP